MHLSKRSSESWDEIVAKLRPSDWSSVGGLWATYRNASILVQLADYAAEHGGEHGLPKEVLEGIRTEAFEVRIRALTTLAQRILSAPISQIYRNLLVSLSFCFI
jgi:hypothetical protein